MPAHIYLRTGRFNDASVANERAKKADEDYFAGNRVAGNMMYEVGYYTHNIHFFTTSAAMEGRRAAALKAAADLVSKVHADMLRDPSMGGMVQHMHLTPLFMQIRFGMWPEVLAAPTPAADLPYMRAMWHAGRGLAYAAGDRIAGAEKERAAIAALLPAPSLKTLYVSSVNVAASIVAVAHEVLSGEIAARRRRTAEAIGHFASAVKLEDGLTYMEPPDLFPMLKGEENLGVPAVLSARCFPVAPAVQPGRRDP